MTRTLEVPVKLFDHAVAAPSYETDGAAGADLFAACAGDVVIAPGARAKVPTGVALALPEGVEAQIRPRSGLAWKHGVTLLNAPGTIDWDYRGEIAVILVNLGQDAITVTRGMRVAQLVLAPVTRGTWRPVDALDETDRGDGGFGSTG